VKWILALATAVAVAACSDSAAGLNCVNRALIVDLRPIDTVVVVGAQFQASATVYCVGGGVVTWRSSDTSVVRVDAATGLVTAISLGTAFADAHHDHYWHIGRVIVTVK